MPNYQNSKAERLNQEAMQLLQKAGTATEPDKSAFIEQANAKIREADSIESRTR